jgi:16S rRNA processing protein RimM
VARGAARTGSHDTRRPAPGAATGRVCVGRIGAAHGVRGEVKLWSFTAEPWAIADYGPFETADGGGLIEIETLREAKDFFVARLAGVTDRDAAERLRNVDLFVPRERLPAPQDGEFYHADLIGLRAETPAGVAFGTVTAIHNFGAGDLLEIAPAAGGDTVLIPFTGAVVPQVEIAAGRLIVDPPAGFFEPGEPEPGSSAPLRRQEPRRGDGNTDG